MKTTIARYELHPKGEPTCYVVGFSIEVNDRSFYADTVVCLEDCKDKTDQEVLDIAYEVLRVSVESKVALMESKSVLVGTIYINTKDRIAKEKLLKEEELPEEELPEEEELIK